MEITKTRVLEARRIWQEVLDGSLRARATVMETMSTSDFPILLGAAYQRELLTEYQQAPAVWPRFATRAEVSDFRPKRLVDILGGRGLLDPVKEGGEYKARALTEGQHEFSVGKYGARIPLTWEMLVNDDLGAFRNMPTRLAQSARNTEDATAVKALLNPTQTDLNTAVFTGDYAPATTALTQENLQAAVQAIVTRKDEDGNPLVIPSAILMVPPALEFTAKAILSATEIRTTTGSRTVVEQNPMAGRLDLVVNPWLSLNTHAKSATTWFVLPSPSSARVAVAQAFLRGYGSPDLRVKADGGNRVTGGAVSPEEGSFDNDTIQYRVRHVMGAATLDLKATFVSYGS